jgi:hypothetical protein
MMVSRASGFAKQAGLGDFVGKAIGKVKGMFRSTPEGPMTVKLRPRSARVLQAPTAPAPAAMPKMERLSGRASIHTPMKPATPKQVENTRIRSEMKRGIGGAD